VSTADQEILTALPPSMRRRFSSLGKYAGEVTVARLAERGFDRKDCGEFMRANGEAIRYVVLITAISRFLKDGIAAAEKAIEIAEVLGQRGVSIGQTELTRGSEDLRSWRELDESLESIIRGGQLERFTSGAHPRDWISEIISGIKHA
jgi:hypothetical protein